MILESLYLDGVIWWEQLRLFKAKSSAVILIMIFWWYEDTQCAEITHRSPKVHNDTVSLSLQWSWFWHLWNTKNRHSVGGHTMCFTWIIKPCVLLFGLLRMFLPFLMSSDKALSLQSGTSAWFIYALRGLHWSNTWAEKKKKSFQGTDSSTSKALWDRRKNKNINAPNQKVLQTENCMGLHNVNKKRKSSWLSILCVCACLPKINQKCWP